MGFLIVVHPQEGIGTFKKEPSHSFMGRCQRKLQSMVMILDSNQNVKRNPWAEGKVPLRFNVLIVRSELDFLCVGVCLCMCILGDGAVACVCINCRSWWVRTRTEREWWLTSQLMTNPYPACNSTPVVRFLHIHMHTLTQTHTHARIHTCKLTHTHIYFWKKKQGQFCKLGRHKKQGGVITLSFICNMLCVWLTHGRILFPWCGWTSQLTQMYS